MALTFGGEQKQMVKILSLLNRQLFQPIVCCIRQHGYVDEKIRELASEFICLRMKRRYNLPGEVWKLRRIVKEHNIDLIHTGVFGSEFSPLLVALTTGVPVIAFLPTTYDLKARFAAEGAGSSILYWKSRIFYMVHAVLARLVKVHYIAYSQTIKESAIKNLHLPPERISIIPLGLVPDEFNGGLQHHGAIIKLKDELGLNGAYPILLNVARISPVKGQKDLLEVMPQILKRFPKAKLLIAGDGDGQLLGQLVDLRAQLKLQEQVQLLGRRDDIAALLHVSDLFVFSSYFEGLPGAIVEAMAAGKPVVAFDIPSLKEVVEDGFSGILVRERNVNKFAESIIQLAENPEIARKMGERSQKIVRERFDIRQNVKSLQVVYQKMLNGSSGVLRTL